MLDLELLKRFYVVAESKNITHAAKKLNLVQSALSKSIASFEHQLKVPIFSRTRKGLELNSKGLELYEYAKEIMASTAQFEKKFYEDDQNVQGDLRIITFPYIGAELLIPLLKEFMEAYPNLCVTISTESDDIVPVQADVAIGGFIAGYPELVQKPLFSVHTQLFASPRYLETFGRPVKPQDLANHKVVTYKNFEYQSPYRSSDLIFKTLETHNCSFSRAWLEVDSLHGLLTAALGGQGICELPSFSTILNADLEQVLPTIKSKEFPMNFIYRKNRGQSRKIAAFYEYLKEKLKS